ncbi:MAG: DUF4190 domain-containing protein [Actinobacteria bacterium]|nr:DUF4190 domain-containing protein [Actinomycetota bacterium]
MGPQPQSNGLAVAALVLGLLGFVFSLLASIPGIVLGHLGRRRARELNGDGAGIALAGLVLSYIITVASVLAILFIAIFIPVFLNQTTKAWNSAVESDLRNAATAQEVAFTSTQSYEVSASGLEQYGFVPSSSSNYNSPVRVITATRTGYCMQATSASGQTYHISSGGSVTTGPC